VASKKIGLLVICYDLGVAQYIQGVSKMWANDDAAQRLARMNSCLESLAFSGFRNHAGFQSTDPIDFDPHHIAGLQESRRLGRKSDPARRACKDHIARL